MSSKDIAVSVRGLSKSYTIAHNVEKHNTMAETLLERVKSPFKRVEKETFWALRDMDFDIKKGDVVGIIGRNGAGKSTLLKILSEITEPTQGEVRLYGRVGSLLEVGTGFHPELTGRENIYLNGSILGMSRSEITTRFDDIVDFAGVEKFLDTPVKRYSSGMYVRLAFAVAAFLEPEILIIDEVLAVGDAEFQKKCLGKMQDVSQSQGKTVLFVSHNMAVINALCNRGIVLNAGQVALDDNIANAVAEYLKSDVSEDGLVIWGGDNRAEDDYIRFVKAYVTDDSGEMASSLDNRKSFTINIEYQVLQPIVDPAVGLMIQNYEGTVMCGSNDMDGYPAHVRMPGQYVSQCTFPGFIFNSGTYSVMFGANALANKQMLVWTPYCLRFTIEDMVAHSGIGGRLPGIIRPNLKWCVEQETA